MDTLEDPPRSQTRPAVVEELFPAPGHYVDQGGLDSQPSAPELQGCLKRLEEGSPWRGFWAGGVFLDWSQVWV